MKCEVSEKSSKKGPGGGKQGPALHQPRPWFWELELSALPDLEHILSAEPDLGMALGKRAHCSAVCERTVLGRKGSFLAAQIPAGYQQQTGPDFVFF